MYTYNNGIQDVTGIIIIIRIDDELCSQMNTGTLHRGPPCIMHVSNVMRDVTLLNCRYWCDSRTGRRNRLFLVEKTRFYNNNKKYCFFFRFPLSIVVYTSTCKCTRRVLPILTYLHAYRIVIIIIINNNINYLCDMLCVTIKYTTIYHIIVVPYCCLVLLSFLLFSPDTPVPYSRNVQGLFWHVIAVCLSSGRVWRVRVDLFFRNVFRRSFVARENRVNRRTIHTPITRYRPPP